MNVTRTWFQAITALAVVVMLFAVAPPVHAAGNVITVTGTADDIDSTVLDGNGTCDLREALDNASFNSAYHSECAAGSTTPGAIDTIAFSIDTGAQTIALMDSIYVDSPVIIDGTTQGGYAGIPLIHITEVDLENWLGWTLFDFTVGSAGSTVKGLKVISTSGGYALVFEEGGNTIVGNYINTDGIASIGDGLGLSLVGSGNTVGGSSAADRNLFGGYDALMLADGSTNVIQGNYFGVGADGTTALTGLSALGDASEAITITASGTSSTLNAIRGNVITGYTWGITLDGSEAQTTEVTVSQNVIAGNKIGVAAEGTTARPNAVGISLMSASSNTIGGVTETDRNVISANTEAQIEILDDLLMGADGNQIQGNYIGTNASGTAAMGAAATYGIHVGGGSGNVIGGTAANSGNVISGNQTGISIEEAASGTIVRGNKIGTDKDGAAAVPNQTGIWAASSANIGDATTAGNNLISGNTSYAVSTGSGVTIYGNRVGVSATGTPLANHGGIELRSGASVAMEENWIGYSTPTGGVVIQSGATVTHAAQNCFTGNLIGVQNMTTTNAPFSSNWWNSPTGPTHSTNPGGAGDAVSNYVTYSSFLTSAPAFCAPVVSLDPTSLSFGDQGVGTTSGAQTVTLTNGGTKRMTINSITTAAPYSLSGGTCPASGGPLNTGASCSILVQFQPLIAGSAPGSVTISTDANSSPDHITLSGNGTGGTHQISLNPTSLDFGEHLVTTTSAAQSVTLTNIGTGFVEITSITTEAPYSLSGGDCPTSGGTVPPGDACSIQVQFSPTTAGSAPGSVSIASDAESSPHTITLAGVGIPIKPVVSLNPTSLNFGNQAIGLTSNARTVTLTNTGTGTLTISGITTSLPYSLGAGTCPAAGRTVNVGDSCTILVRFAPSEEGSATGSVSIASDADTTPDTIALSGTGVLIAPAVSLDLTSLDFGEQLVGTTSSPQTVTLTNTGNGVLAIGTIEASGPYSLAGSTCADGGTVSVSASCTILVRFAPTEEGGALGEVSIASDAGSTDKITLSGTGIQPMLSPTPSSLSFGNQVIGTTSAAQMVTLTNSGTAVLHITGITTEAPYSLSGGTCLTLPQSLNPAGSCTIYVQFAPTAMGSALGSVSITSDAPTSPNTIALSGTGTQSVLTPTPAMLSFGSQLVGTSSAAQTITLSNTGTAALTLSEITTAAPYSLGEGSCLTLPQVLEPDASCTFTVRFSPSAAGAAWSA